MNNFINLRISGFGLDLQEISNQIGMIPHCAYKKGDIFVDKKRDGKEVIYQEDCWIAGTETFPNETIEQALERFLKQIIPVSNYVNNLAKKNEVTIWISAYPDDEQTNIHLSVETIRALCEIGVSFDCSTLFLKQFYDGTYEKK